MNEMRQTILSDLEVVASKSRFGLFNQPPPLAVGDDSLFKQKQGNCIIIQHVEGKMGNLCASLETC
jgi:hypothetical protein